MKLLCIKAGTIKKPDGTKCHGDGLEEGKIYTTKGKPYIDPESGNKCYYIEGLGSKLVERFTELLDNEDINELSLEESLEEALANENYELAEKILKKIKK
jgi:hypothetical protein